MDGMKEFKTHLDSGGASLCGIAGFMTNDRIEVTCKTCIRRMKAFQKPAGAEKSDDWMQDVLRKASADAKAAKSGMREFFRGKR